MFCGPECAWACRCSFYREVDESVSHFATFPPKLIEPCILAGSPEGGVVLDPFVGSGTAAMVARDLGRRAVGIDASVEYLAMARRRIGAQLAMEVGR